MTTFAPFASASAIRNSSFLTLLPPIPSVVQSSRLISSFRSPSLSASLGALSSGVGNCVNMFSLLASADVPFVALVTMRGEHAEFNPWQVPMGRAAADALSAMGLAVHRVDRPEDVGETVGAALDAAFRGGQRVAVLLSQRLIGRKEWVTG